MARVVMHDGWREQVQEAAVPKLEKLGDVMVAEARDLVPVQTGYLRSSIYRRMRGFILEFGAYASYAALVEFGEGRGDRPPKPFLRPPAYRNRGRL